MVGPTPVLIATKDKTFFLEIDFDALEFVEDVLSQNAVDLSLKGAGEVLCIRNKNALFFPNNRSDGERCQGGALLIRSRGAIARMFEAALGPWRSPRP